MSKFESEDKGMFGGRECLCLKTEGTDFETAREVATNKAREMDPGAQLLYWFDRESSMCSPGAVCSGTEIPEWLIKAGKLCDTIPVGINDGAFFFAFAGSNCRNQASV